MGSNEGSIDVSGEQAESTRPRGRRGIQEGVLQRCWTRVGDRPMHAWVSARPTSRALPPLVLVHGLGVSSRYLLPVARRLTQEFRVLVPDLPGFGRSPGPARALDVRGLSDALAAWMDAMGIDHAAFLANSFGCQIVTELAVLAPGRVTRAVLEGPTVDCHARTALRQIGRLIVAAFREPLSLSLTALWDYLTTSPRRLWATLRYCLEDAIEERLPRVRAPMLVVRGARDPIVPGAWAETVARLLPSGRLVVLPGLGHASVYTAPDTLARLAIPFLRGGQGVTGESGESGEESAETVGPSRLRRT